MPPPLSLRGIFPVVPTPLHEDESLDLEGLAHLVDHYATTGCHGVVVLGSGGEYPYLAFDERLAVTRTAVLAARGRIPVVAGAGFTGLREARRFVEEGAALGASALLVALPTYYAVEAAEAVDFFERLARASAVPLLYYHFPDVTRLSLPAAAMQRILRLEGVVGIKESSLRLAEARRHLAAAGKEGFASFTGTSLLLLPMLDQGGAGAICPIAAVAPRLVLDCHEAWTANDRGRAAALEERILGLMPLMSPLPVPPAARRTALRALSGLPLPLRLGSRSRHAVFKEALRRLGHPITATVRRPLPQLGPADGELVAAVLGSFEA
jgi:dihydrodipicolinate synthase/N-acetylneuraminate lyase